MGSLANTNEFAIPGNAVIDVKSRPVKVITDVHLGQTDPDGLQILCRLLPKWADDASQTAPHVAILGDFYDLLCNEDSEFSNPKYDPIYAAVRKLANDKRLTFVIGNHDLRLRDELFGYLAPTSWLIEYWDRISLGDYRHRLNKAPFASKIGLTRENSFHRYVVLRFSDANWLLFHGDEINYGYDCRQVSDGNWRDLEFFIWRFLDSLPAQPIAEGLRLANKIVSILKRAFHEAISTSPAGALAMSAGDTTKLGAPGSEAASDAFMRALTEGLRDLAAKPEEIERDAAAARTDLVGAEAIPQKLVVDFGLPEVRQRATDYCADDRPVASAQVETVELAGLVLGHRHEEEELPHFPPKPGVLPIIDAGAWLPNVPCATRNTVTSISGKNYSTKHGQEELAG